MGGKKNKRAQRKQKKMRVEPERLEEPVRLEEGPGEAAGPSNLEGIGREEPPRSNSESLESKNLGKSLDQGVQEFGFPFDSIDESQNVISDTLQLLKNKNLEANDISDLLTNAMHYWLKDMLKKVEAVKAEISATRDLVLPTCAVLDKLESRSNEDIRELVHSILEKVEYMVKQIPVATAVIGMVMEQIDLLQNEEFPRTSNREFRAIQDESSSSAEPQTQENTPVASSGDPESDTLEHVQQESAMTVSSDDANLEGTAALTAENTTEDSGEISQEILSVMRTKDEETNGFKDLLRNLMKHRVKDMMKKIDIATTEASVTRNLVMYASDVLDSLQTLSKETDELKAVIEVLLRKVEYIMLQVSAATKVVDYTVEQISQLEETEDFRNEILMSSAYEAAGGFLDSSDEAQPGFDDPMERSQADLETAVMGLHLQDPTERPRKRENSGLKRRSNSGEVHDESYLAEEHMRGVSSASDEDISEISYVFEDETFLELISPKDRTELENYEDLENEKFVTETSNSYFVVEDDSKGNEISESVDDIGLEEEFKELGLEELKKNRYSEAFDKLGGKKENLANKKEASELSAEEAKNQQSSDEDEVAGGCDIEGVSVFKLDRRG